MLPFQKLVDESQMPKTQEYTDTFILTKKLFLVCHQGLQSISNPVERPCTYLAFTRFVPTTIFLHSSPPLNGVVDTVPHTG